MPNKYVSAIVITKLKRRTWTHLVAVQDGFVTDPETKKEVPVYIDKEVTEFTDEDLTFDLPVRVYGYNIVALGIDLTMRIWDHSLHDTKVMAKIDVREEDKKKIELNPGYIGVEFANIVKDLRYVKEYPMTKEDALATYTDLGVKVPYDRLDKDEKAQFCQWEGSVKPEVVAEVLTVR